MNLAITKNKISVFSFIIASILLSSNVMAGGPWVLGKGQSTLSLGFSRKVGEQRWAPFVNGTNNSQQQHDAAHDSTPTNLSDDIITYELIHNPDSTTVDEKFHDFRYYYFQGAFGICKNLELDITLNYLIGREASTRDPKTGKLYTYEPLKALQ
jgi:hypothetical protein